MLHRKGMSPLIATILLMAFAVALGGMIMNWSIDQKSVGDCNTVKVDVAKLCIQDNNIVLSVRNNPQSASLQEVRVSYLQSNYENSLRIVNSALAPGQPLDEIAVPATIGPGTKVSLIGVVGTADDIIVCQEPLYEADPIKEC